MTRTSLVFRPGKRPAQPARPHLSFSGVLREHRAAGLTAPPAKAMYAGPTSAGVTWGMDGNDQYGDCVEAGLAHLVAQLTAYGSGEFDASETQVLGWYSAITGFDPAKPSTDGGTYTQDALAYARKTGLSGHKVTAYGVVDHKTVIEVKQGIALFGSLLVGMEFPDSAMDQFNNGADWSVVKGAKIEGGHCVLAVGYDTDGVYAVTWGQVVKMSWAFWTKYVDEAWVVLDADGLGKSLAYFTGLPSFYALGAIFAALTGDANPVPAPVPVDPGPPPVGAYDVVALARDIEGLLKSHNLL